MKNMYLLSVHFHEIKNIINCPTTNSYYFKMLSKCKLVDFTNEKIIWRRNLNASLLSVFKVNRGNLFIHLYIM